MWLSDGRSLYDLFGFEWTLLRLGGSPPDSSLLERAMARARAELRVVEVASQEVLDLYGAPLALIRPDQIVAWRGASDVDAESTTKIVTGT